MNSMQEKYEQANDELARAREAYVGAFAANTRVQEAARAAQMQLDEATTAFSTARARAAKAYSDLILSNYPHSMQKDQL